jgi:transcriptional regulator with XRE-family HTH domain
MRLNSDLVRDRRRELLLSQRALGELVRQSAAAVHRIERGDLMEEFTLREVQRLGDALQVDPICLFVSESPPDPQSDWPPQSRSEILALLGSCLARESDPIPVDALAELFDLSRSMVLSLVDDLDAGLRPLGLRAHLAADSVRIISDGAGAVPKSRLRVLRRRIANRRRLDIHHASLLRAGLVGTTAKKIVATNNGMASFGTLLGADLLTDSGRDSQPVCLAKDARFSLLVDDERLNALLKQPEFAELSKSLTTHATPSSRASDDVVTEAAS